MDLDRVRRVVEPVVTAGGLELFDLEVTAGIVRVLVDREGGIDLEAVSAVSQQVAEALDADDPTLLERHALEVSTPGVERPLRTPQHFQRYVGTTVSIRTKAGADADRRVQATLESADDEGVTIAGRRISYGEIERARTVFEWGPAPKPGAPRPANRNTKKKATTR